MDPKLPSAPGNQSIISGETVNVHGGTFIQHIGGYGRKSPFEILKESIAHGAFHNSGARFDPPKCHPNTRVAVLDKIMNWIKRYDKDTEDRYIMWLTGAAGAGKSSIAQTFIELCLLHELVMASFFFSKSDGTRNHAGSLIATLVYQIYHSVPASRNCILSVIDKDPLIFTRCLEHQFTHLVARPLRNIQSSDTVSLSGPYRVIVIDGLDECLDTKIQQQILHIITNAIRECNLPVLFLIVSRPGHEISVILTSHETTKVVTRLYLDDKYKPSEDIRNFLIDSFEEIRTTHPFKTQIPALWPAPEIIALLVQKSSGQFIYAATAVRYVQSIRHQPHHRLDALMTLRPTVGDLPFAQLDALYTAILSSVEDKERVLYALSIYSHKIVNEGLCTLDLEQFMNLDEGGLEILLCDLGALVSIKVGYYDDIEVKTLQFHHASLHDFLLDQARSNEYFVDIDKYLPEHLANILRYLASNFHMMNRRASSVDHFFKEHSSLSTSSAELIKQASSFPLARALDTAIRLCRPRAKGFICFTLLPFLRHMARYDDQWFMIERHQHEALDQVFLSRMPYYYSEDYLTALLCLACHAGKNICVPYFGTDLGPTSVMMKFNEGMGDDVLGIHYITLDNIHKDKQQYWDCLLGFLQDAERSHKYAVGEEAYATAAFFFIQLCERLKWRHYRSAITEHEICEQLIQESGVWRFKDKIPSSLVVYFIFLGYISFFLTRSGTSARLILLCCQKKQIFDAGPLKDHFPTRSALVRQAMSDYIRRVTSVYSITMEGDSPLQP